MQLIINNKCYQKLLDNIDWLRDNILRVEDVSNAIDINPSNQRIVTLQLHSLICGLGHKLLKVWVKKKLSLQFVVVYKIDYS